MRIRSNNSLIEKFSSKTSNKIFFFILGIVLLSISSKISIPFYPVPMTLQTFVVYFIAASMGIIGFYSTVSYVFLGLIGLPIFASGGGIGYIFSPTFGFLYGMILASFLISYLSKNMFDNSFLKILVAIFSSSMVIFICGILHLSFYIGLQKAISVGFVPFIYSELLKIALAIFLTWMAIKKK